MPIMATYTCMLVGTLTGPLPSPTPPITGRTSPSLALAQAALWGTPPHKPRGVPAPGRLGRRHRPGAFPQQNKGSHLR